MIVSIALKHMNDTNLNAIDTDRRTNTILCDDVLYLIKE